MTPRSSLRSCVKKLKKKREDVSYIIALSTFVIHSLFSENGIKLLGWNVASRGSIAVIYKRPMQRAICRYSSIPSITKRLSPRNKMKNRYDSSQIIDKATTIRSSLVILNVLSTFLNRNIIVKKIVFLKNYAIVYYRIDLLISL